MDKKENSSPENDQESSEDTHADDGLLKPKTSPDDLAIAGNKILGLSVEAKSNEGTATEKLHLARESAIQAITGKIQHCENHGGELSEEKGTCPSADICLAIQKFRELDRLPSAVDILASKILIPDDKMDSSEWTAFVDNDAGLLAQQFNVPIGAVFLREKIKKASGESK
jgi:hypothetical protein